MIHNLDKFLFSDNKKVFLGDKVGNDQSDAEISILSRWRQEQSSYHIKTIDKEQSANNHHFETQYGKLVSNNDERFKTDFKSIQRNIQIGKIQKGVAYNSFKIEINFIPELSKLYNASTCPAHYAYGAWSDESGFIGISPELLYTQQDNLAHTYAIAGTDKAATFKRESIGPEHQLVVKGITESLDNLGFDYKINSKDEIQFHDYSHKLTEIEIDNHLLLDSKKFLEIHPSPAISGYPQSSFKQIKNQLDFENVSESKYYAGLYKIKSNKIDKTIVMIRNVFWDKNILEIHAGCGVVASSEYEKELEESHLKIKSVLDIIGIELI